MNLVGERSERVRRMVSMSNIIKFLLNQHFTLTETIHIDPKMTLIDSDDEKKLNGMIALNLLLWSRIRTLIFIADIVEKTVGKKTRATSSKTSQGRFKF
jgi:hypothetical protein